MESETTIEGLFNGKVQFSVPAYQRAYSWQVGRGVNDQVGQFLRDIKEQDPKRQYYLGHFLFERKDGDTFKYDVIDGQQRLTTVVIFMSCIYNALKERSVESIDGVEIEELYETYVKHRAQKFLTVREDQAYFMNRIVLCDSNAARMQYRKSEGCIADAAAYFDKELAAMDTQTLIEWCNIVAHAKVTTFVVQGEDAKQTATQVFAFQNDRGKALTTLEKVKAYLMNYIYKKAESSPEEYIDPVEVSFESIYSKSEVLNAGEDTVLHWHCQAFVGYGPAFESIRASLEKTTNPMEWIVTFASQLAQSFRIVEEIEQTEARFGGYVADICYLGRDVAMPLMLKLKHFRVADEQTALKYIEQILFKMMFTTGRYVTNRLVEYAREFKSDNFDTYLMPRLKKAARDGFKDYWQFNQWCLDYFESTRYHYCREIKYVLYKYENHLRELTKSRPLSIDECASIFNGNKSVENTLDHITPQNPDFTKYTEQFENDYVSNIGNLSLLTWSGNASKNCHNPCLPEQMKKYDGVYLSQKEVLKDLERGVWCAQQIDERRTRIVTFVKKHWELETNS